jgi:hypothetical protein
MGRMSMDTTEVVQVLVLIAAIAGFLFGVYQYQQAQKWKRLEFAATQLQRMYEDPELVLGGRCSVSDSSVAG